MKRFVAGLLHLIAFCALYFTAADVIHRLFVHSDNPEHYLSNLVAVGTLCVFSIILLCTTIYFAITSSRRARYANVTDNTHAIAHELRDLSWHLRSFVYESRTREEMVAAYKLAGARLQILLSHVSEIFSILTATKCRASIKLYHGAGSELYIFTACRDTKSHLELGVQDADRRKANLDKAEDYPHFQTIMNDRGVCPGGISDNVRELSGVNFSVFERYFTRRSEWKKVCESAKKKPYRSVIYYSIRQFESSDYGFDGQGAIGVLQVDSQSRGVFDRRWDLGLMATFADALFHTLRLNTQLAAKIKEA